MSNERKQSKLDELIQQYCPNGVECKKLGDFATISRGGSFQKKDFLAEGFPCIHYGQIYTRYGLFAKNTFAFISAECAEKQKKASPGDIVMAVTSENIEDVCKCLAWLGDGEVAVSGHSAIIHHNQNPKYLVYYFHTADFFAQKRKLAHGTKVIEVTPDKLKDISVPLPPLEVQSEIVRILDNFTELTARQKQYGYYRNKLLTFENETSMQALGDVCDIIAGGTPSKKNSEFWNGGTIKWLGSTVCQNQKTVDSVTDYITEEGLASSSAKMMKKDTTLIALVGATIGKVAFLPFEAAINQNIAGVYPKDITVLDPSYVYYACTTLYPKFLALTQGSKLAMANMSFVRGLQIPVPPIAVQKKIVYVLDNFDTICSDLKIGLPAEIEARQKQYEFYRDALLTYAATGKTILTDRQTDRQA